MLGPLHARKLGYININHIYIHYTNMYMQQQYFLMHFTILPTCIRPYIATRVPNSAIACLGKIDKLL